ncbi:FkbM family methyltransferase [Rhodopirellula sp. P2]|uniref:FkbM family methyltransferase n=1 Tax=Rhodopirellula sp. P2 TaxID=2127060 RepID=UPI0023678970|nr:FkbM family methyltransferase [Rhodopirellula sp. P2]WDQ15656.1 FkbM family methyltransferase [Rhodopirellula sp. P2]
MDIGVNVGYYTLPFANRLQLLGGTGAVHAFEPVEANFRAFASGVDANRLSERVRLHRYGLGERFEEVQISMTEDGETGNAVVVSPELAKEREIAHFEKIQILCLDNLVEELNIQRFDLIKIDIEGGEISFLRGARNFITRFLPVIYGEFNSYFIDVNGQKTQEAIDFLAQLGYRCHRQLSRSHHFAPIGVYQEGIGDLLFLPPTIPAADLSFWAD